MQRAHPPQTICPIIPVINKPAEAPGKSESVSSYAAPNAIAQITEIIHESNKTDLFS